MIKSFSELKDVASDYLKGKKEYKKPLDNLKTKFSDFLRPNIYVIEITPKTPFYQQGENLIGILCHEATFPFYTFTTNSFFYNNRETHILNKIDYDPATFNFYVDKDNIILGFFDAWFKQMINKNHQFGYYDDYISTIIIEIYDRRFQLAARAKLIDAFPVNLESINLAYAQNDTITNMQVSFQFKAIEYKFQKTDKEELSQFDKMHRRAQAEKTNARRIIGDVKNIKNVKPFDIVANAKKIF